MTRSSGRGAVWLARVTGGHEVAGSSPVAPIRQPPENKEVTIPKADTDNRHSENLVSGLFLESENAPDLKLVMQSWPRLSIELAQAIVKMVR